MSLRGGPQNFTDLSSVLCKKMGESTKINDTKNE